MPVGPYPIAGKVYDIDGTTALQGATVIALNVTTGERTSVLTAVDGSFVLDLANLASAYTNADKIQVTAKYTTNANIRSLSRRHTVNTAVGMIDLSTMILHPGDDGFASCYIQYAGVSNIHSAVLRVDYYDRKNDVLLFHVSAGIGMTQGHNFGYTGFPVEGGFVRIYQDETAGRLSAPTVVK